MGDVDLRLTDSSADGASTAHPRLGRVMVDQGKIAEQDLAHALRLQTHVDAPLGDIMVSEGLVERQDVLAALAAQAGTQGANLDTSPPPLRMAHHLSASMCLRFGVVPLREENGLLHVATASPRDFKRLQSAMGVSGHRFHPVIVDELQIRAHQSRLYGTLLAEKAAKCVPDSESCRTWQGRGHRRSAWACVIAGSSAVCLAAWPLGTLTVLTLMALVTLAMTTFLKLLALIVQITPDPLLHWPSTVSPVRPIGWLPTVTPRTPHSAALLPLGEARSPAAVQMTGVARLAGGDGVPVINAGEARFRMPRVSVLVPLLREREIADQLVERLSGLTYPKSLLEVVLVLEASDAVTRETLRKTTVPEWMSVIEVPEAGKLTTKPRALNYALDFCRGSIVGVWDAEDWPEPDQIERIVTHFAKAPAEVACLQGILDYYNSRTNWLTRCFAIEYATWWRVVIPGIARLGLVVPLGGTTLFFRRQALADLGGWDAHNVTEDADLGVRLARHGYRTELVSTVTREEATSRAWPWVRQRSRWLKGFLITYFVHMRRPGRLLGDLGLKRFIGIQALFLASVAHFALAPMLWSFWVTLFGITHPVANLVGDTVFWGMIAFFIAAEALNLAAGIFATSGRAHRHLIPFVPSMMLYFVLGTFAAYKALWELIRVPFYWDKTQHGVSHQTDPVPLAIRSDQAES